MGSVSCIQEWGDRAQIMSVLCPILLFLSSLSEIWARSRVCRAWSRVLIWLWWKCFLQGWSGKEKKKAVIWFWQINDYAKLMICYFKLCIGLSRGIRNINFFLQKKWLHAVKFSFSLIKVPTKTDFWVKKVFYFVFVSFLIYLSMHLNREYNLFDLFVVGKSYEK